MGLLALFMVVELAVGALSGSIAVLADAGHMVTDAGALAGGLWALYLTGRPASGRWTYGRVRAEILAGAANGVALAAVGAVILFEACRRLASPPPVAGGYLMATAAGGVAVTLVATLVLAGADRRSLNVEGVFQHVLTDLYAFGATLVAGLVIVLTGFRRADPLASLLVVALMGRAAARLLVASGRVLLEGTPEHVDLEEVRNHILGLPEVVSVHDLHAWTLGSSHPALSAHVVVTDRCLADGASARLLDALQACLAGHFDVSHSTFQLEPGGHVDHELAHE